MSTDREEADRPRTPCTGSIIDEKCSQCGRAVPQEARQERSA